MNRTSVRVVQPILLAGALLVSSLLAGAASAGTIVYGISNGFNDPAGNMIY